MAQQVAKGNADLSARTESQAGSLQQTAAAMAQFGSTVRQTAEHAHLARELAGAAAATSAHSADVMRQMVATMERIDAASGQVADITAVIDRIAFQTNILALNAAVESARAGEHGRGVAVVAREVRTLARHSAVAAREIRGLIDNSTGKVRDGAALADQARQALSAVAGKVDELAGLVNEIAASSKEQALGITQINQAIAHLDDVTQRNAALVEQAAAATHVMRDEAAGLGAVVGRYQLAGAVAPPDQRE